MSREAFLEIIPIGEIQEFLFDSRDPSRNMEPIPTMLAFLPKPGAYHSVWSREDAKTLLDSIPKDSVSGLRDLALIAAMFYSFAPFESGNACPRKGTLFTAFLSHLTIAPL
jgi:hypothetical protein